MTSFLRRPTNFSGGISAGGGDTGWDVSPQETLLLKRVHTTPQRATLPRGAVILERVVIPDGEQPATVGTIDIDDIENLVSYGAALPANAVERAPLLTSGILNEDTRFTFTPTGLDGYCWVGFKVMLPRPRS